MADVNWSVAEAKSRFSELIARTHTEGPQTVTRHGKACVVVVSAAEWASHAETARSLVEVLLDPDVRGVLTSEEATFFHRDDADGRLSPVF
jgi:prevent-host-death family protein